MPITHIDDLPDVIDDLQVEDREGGVKIRSVPAKFVETDVELALERDAMRQARAHRSRAYGMYLLGKTPDAIAKELGSPDVTAETIMYWAKDGDWAGRLRRRNDDREKVVVESVRRLRIEKAEVEAESALRISTKIRDKAEEMLDGDTLTPMGLKNIADAAKASGDLGAHGMGEGPASQPETGKPAGKVPLVVIFPGGGLPPEMPKEAEVIEVKCGR